MIIFDIWASEIRKTALIHSEIFGMPVGITFFTNGMKKIKIG